jgi:hypothetical protein
MHIRAISISMNECHPKSNVSHDCVHGYTINLTNMFEEFYFHFVVYCVVAAICHEVSSHSMLFQPHHILFQMLSMFAKLSP